MCQRFIFKLGLEAFGKVVDIDWLFSKDVKNRNATRWRAKARFPEVYQRVTFRMFCRYVIDTATKSARLNVRDLLSI